MQNVLPAMKIAYANILGKMVEFDQHVYYSGHSLYCHVTAQGGELNISVDNNEPDQLIGVGGGPFTSAIITLSGTATGQPKVTAATPLDASADSFEFYLRFDDILSTGTIHVDRYVGIEAEAKSLLSAQPPTGLITFVAIADEDDPTAKYKIVFIRNPNPIYVADYLKHTAAVVESGPPTEQFGPMALLLP